MAKKDADDSICAKCKEPLDKDNRHYCFGCKAYYCENCVTMLEGDDCYSNYVKYHVYCPKDMDKHHSNSCWR